MSATLAFDRLAPSYDSLTDGELFTLMRRRTHDVFLRWFRPGCRVLEIGCGTGRDTAFLTRHGIRVVACDPSEAMVSRTLGRLANEGASDRATVMPCGLENLRTFLDALGEREAFDGFVSNFGALNCVECLMPLRELAAEALRPGGAVLLNLMGRTCVIEAVYFALTGRGNLVRRRQADGAVQIPVAGVNVAAFYHRTRELKTMLGPNLRLARVTGIGVAIPPPYLEPRWTTLPRFTRARLADVDAFISTWPPFNRLGDHILLQFVKRRSPHA